MKARFPLIAKILAPIIVLAFLPVAFYAAMSLPKLSSARDAILSLKIEEEKEEILQNAKRTIRTLDNGLHSSLVDALLLSLLLLAAFTALAYYKVYLPLRGSQNFLKEILHRLDVQSKEREGLAAAADDLIEMRDNLAQMFALFSDGSKIGQFDELLTGIKHLEEDLVRVHSGDFTVDIRVQNKDLQELRSLLARFLVKFREIFAHMRDSLRTAASSTESLSKATLDLCATTEREGQEIDRLDLALDDIIRSYREEMNSFVSQFKKLKLLSSSLAQSGEHLDNLRKHVTRWGHFVANCEEIITPALFQVTMIEDKLNQIDGQLPRSQENAPLDETRKTVRDLFSLHKGFFQELTKIIALLKEMRRENEQHLVAFHALEGFHESVRTDLLKGLGYLKGLYKTNKGQYQGLQEVKEGIPKVFQAGKNKIDTTLANTADLRQIKFFLEEIRTLVDSFALGETEPAAPKPQIPAQAPETKIASEPELPAATPPTPVPALPADEDALVLEILDNDEPEDLAAILKEPAA